MLLALLVLTLLPVLVVSSGEGNIHLLEYEVAEALRSCVTPGKAASSKETTQRQRRSEGVYDNERSPRIDNNAKPEINQYGHERRNATGPRDQIQVLNATDYDYGGYGTGSGGERLVNTVPQPANGGDFGNMTGDLNRTKRSEPLLNKRDSDQVDSRGIPRESELWNRIQSSVSSHKSRVALQDQIRACFQELQSEAEDNGCSYSNKLERCLMLHFADRKAPAVSTQNN